MNIEAVLRKPKVLRALTSLDAGEFARLLAAFEQSLAERRTQVNRFGHQRQRAFGATGNLGVLPTPKARLFFVLFYFKCCPLQEVMGVLFGLSQPQVCLWVGRLTPLVSAALGRELLLPARKPADLTRLLEEVPELRVLLTIDGTERPIRRPKDKARKKPGYSGKKKAHRKKNLLVSSGRDKRVVCLGPTSPGSGHDKTLADESGLVFPPDSLALKDTGFQGDTPPGGCATLQPKKKPRGRELHPLQKTINQLISQVRVGVEHAIGAVKKVPPRRRHLAQPAERLCGRGHGSGRGPAQPARRRSQLKEENGFGPKPCPSTILINYKAYCTHRR